MKSVKTFFNEEIKNKIIYHDIKGIVALFYEAGYYGYNPYLIGYVHAYNCRTWCLEYCPNDIVFVSGYLFFTEKETAMLMKLSVL